MEKLRPSRGMRHLDVAGGTGDVAFRVLDAMRGARPAPRPSSAAAIAAAAMAGPGSSSSSSSGDFGHVTVCDINAAMLAEGQKKAAARGVSPGAMDWVEGNAEELPFPGATSPRCCLHWHCLGLTAEASGPGMLAPTVLPAATPVQTTPSTPTPSPLASAM